jgi:hypothetical protein
MIEKILKDFQSFKNSPITYILFLVFSLSIYVLYVDRSEKAKSLKECVENERRLSRKFEDLFFKKEKISENDSLIQKL